MRADLLLEHFDTLVRTPSDVAMLEAAILDLAVRGQLVPQDPNDEPASELLKHLRNRRNSLACEGKIRQSKNLPPIRPDNMPFKLPGSWRWVRLRELGQVVGGGTPDTGVREYWTVRGVPWLTPADLSGLEGKIISRGRRDISELGLSKSSATLLPSGSVLFSSRAPIGYVAIASNDLSTNQGFKSCVPYVMEMNEYIYYFLKHAARRINEEATGTTFKEVSGKKVELILVPLPPLAEQKRIVARLDELLAQTRELSSRLEEADLAFIPAARAAFHALAKPPCPVSTSSGVPQPPSDAWQRIADTFDSFAGDPRALDLLKQTILQLAVQGQLVLQDPHDEPASTLLERIQAEKVAAMGEAQIHGVKRLIGIKPRGGSVPLPQEWEWCRLADVTLNIHYGYTASADYSLKNFRMLRITDIQDNKVDWESVPGCEIENEIAQKYLLRDGDILIARTGGTIGKTYLVRDLSVKAVFASYLIRVIPALNIHSQYLKFFLESPSYWDQLARHSKGTGQPNVNATSLSGLVLPLPPFAEQQRIVAKVKQLLGLCDALAAEAAAAETVRTRLLAAVVNGG